MRCLVRHLSFGGLLAVVALFVAGCGGGSSGTSATTTAGTTPSTSGRLAAPLAIEPGSTSAEATIGPEGGSLRVTSAAGTEYVIDVPKDALDAPVTITATPVASLPSAGADAQAVILQPSGQTFAVPVTVTITPQTAVPVERQVLFTFSDDGAAVWPAEPKMDTADIVLVTTHFTGFGFADLKNLAREKYVKWTTDRAADRINSEVGEALQAERERQLLGEELNPEAMQPVIDAILQYEEEVVEPRIANADTSCAAAMEAIASLFALERQRQLLGVPERRSSDGPTMLEKALSVGLPQCEKEAIEKCKAARDPAILIRFYLGVNRQHQLLGAAGPYEGAGMAERAQDICAPLAYQIDGGLQDWQVSQKVCNIMEPFRLQSSVGTMKFSGGLTGTYTFKGVFASNYTGTYRFTFPNGKDQPGKLVGSGGGSIAGQAGSGTERYTVAPAGPSC
jgi:hypothetical protein